MKDRTDFGKHLRVLRAKENETLGDMAAKLGVSSPFLSAVERGSKAIPLSLIEKLGERYTLAAEEANELRTLAAEETKEFHLAPNKEDRVLVSLFSEKLLGMPLVQKQKLKALLLENYDDKE